MGISVTSLLRPALAAAIVEGSSIHMAQLCRGLYCGDPKFPVIDYIEAEGGCRCIQHPCWNDGGLKHECHDPSFPYVIFSYDEQGALRCACSKVPHYSSPYIAKVKCAGHSCKHEEHPVMDWDPDEQKCLCRQNPCEDLNGRKHSCLGAHPILRYREELDSETGEVSQHCDCMAAMVDPGDVSNEQPTEPPLRPDTAQHINMRREL
eukprot:gnl/TRDRNA2_/TRDRNA2_186340_c0_seq1.p1 gnl/TRDRNA2_/TRDRNA2_186340_c0~~gnl/TRDRNA2_/TRDRNA2_186340_c0_seq1.p1  ORF type:complete len:206 (+),score=22.08 gnl/TRDRNA2_/TRDRNA2_186340_c0_seq1:84-701(+)